MTAAAVAVGLAQADGPTSELVGKYEQGMSIRQLAADTGCSYTVIRDALTQAGVTLRPWGAPRSTTREPVTSVAAAPAGRRAVVVIPESQWPGFLDWCDHHRVTLQRLAHAPGQIPRFEAPHPVTCPPGHPFPRRARPRQDTLSDRELQVLALIADGLTNQRIARGLHLSEDTIKSHTRRIFRKLGVHDRCAAVATALRHGLVE